MIFSIGTKIPDFSAPATGNQRFNSADYKGQRLVLYFYPKDSTPGCTTEGQDFNRLLPEFRVADCQVFGISRDSLKRHENFKAKQGFAFDLISDVDEKVCQLFDVIKMKKLYGKEYLGIDRSTFVINRQGDLAQTWHNVKVKGHAEEVLNFICMMKE
jgi:peroxiredoxin Q/BCP